MPSAYLYPTGPNLILRVSECRNYVVSDLNLHSLGGLICITLFIPNIPFSNFTIKFCQIMELFKTTEKIQKILIILQLIIFHHFSNKHPLSMQAGITFMVVQHDSM